MPKYSLKYARQITSPLNNSTSMQISKVQNSSFCPGLYLPMGGTPSSSFLITRPTRRSHNRSLVIKKFARKNWITSPRNSTNITTPMNGCRMRVHGPPPNRLLSQNSAGWNNASPDSAAMKKQIATSQWLVRWFDV